MYELLHEAMRNSASLILLSMASGILFCCVMISIHRKLDFSEPAMTRRNSGQSMAGGFNENVNERFSSSPSAGGQDRAGHADERLSTSELLAGKDAAEQTAKAQSQFLADMSHEIRSPLSGIIGILDLLQNSRVDPDQARYVYLAQLSASSLLTIVNNVLDMAKIESGRVILEDVPFDVRHLLDQLVQLFTQKARNKGLLLNSEIDAGLPEIIRGDSMRLRQVLVNLLDNAIKFTEQGTVDVHVMLTGQSGDALRLRFEVIDTGPGVPENLRTCIFQPYIQAGLSDARRHGTGLGLSISRRLVELMEGEIDFRSTPGEGSAFWFEAPFSKPDPAAETAPSSQVEIAPNRQEWNAIMALSNPHKCRVLVAEDSEINRILCREMLTQLGVEVQTVENGRQAVDAVEDGRFDLVLMDCKMPIMDGYAAARKIRAREANQGRARIPIIALTAHALDGDREASLAAGMDDHLSKPFRFQQLQALLASFLNTAKTNAG